MSARRFAMIVVASLAFTAPALAADEAPIGTATMAQDGTIELRLRAELPNHGGIGEGTMTYRPGDKDYAEILRHLGGMKVGETKPVKPWPDP